MDSPILIAESASVEQFQPALRVRDRFIVGRARKRPFPGPLPIADRALGQLGRSKVLGDQFRLPLGDFRIVLLQSDGDPRMVLAAARKH